MKREDIEKTMQRFVAPCKYGITSSDISLVAAELEKLFLPPAEGAEEYIDNQMNVIKLAESIEYRINAEYRKHKNLDWAKIASLKLAHLMTEFASQQQPTAEGAEKILDKHWNNFSINVKKAALIAMREFATLHAQRIADKMVSERIRGELEDFALMFNGKDNTCKFITYEHIDEYFKSRKK